MQYFHNLYMNSYIYFERLSQMLDLLIASMKENICFINISTFYNVHNYNYTLTLYCWYFTFDNAKSPK